MDGMAVLGQSLRALRRDWAAGELRVLAAALVIAVASVAAVGFFTDRIRVVMERQSSELLGADLVIESPYPVQQALSAEARARGLALADTLTLRSVVLAGDATQLAEVKAVGPGYPLRGVVETADAPFAEPRRTRDIPPPGGAWLDPRLMQVLGLAVGDTVEVGAKALVVDRVLAYEPDRGGDFFSIAPRLMMNLADIPATQLVQPGSRVKYRVLLAGSLEAVAAYGEWAGGRLGPNEELEGVRDARPELRRALERAQRFLGLAALVSVILAGVGIAIAARRFAQRHWDSVAVLRCLGATQGLVLRLYTLEMLLLAAAAGLLGVTAGWLAQEGLTRLLGGIAPGELPMPSWRPLAPALVTGLVTLLGFAMPPLLRLREVPPLRVLRRELGPVDARAAGLYLPALSAAALLVLWQAGDVRLGLYVLGGALGTVLALALGAWGLVRGLTLLRGRVGVAWRFGLVNIARRGGASVVQVVALGLGIMVLLVLTLVRGDLLESWRATLPEDAPNHFLINIQTDEVEAVDAFLDRRLEVAVARLLPMVRGRLLAVNERPVSPGADPGKEDQPVVRREYNLSWAADLQEDNRILDGHWWRPEDHGQPLVSVEQGVAQRLGIALGDKLRFLIAGRELEVRVASLRSVEWDSFRANFFMIFPPGVLDDYPATWITAFHLPPERKPLLAELVRSFPSVTVIDLEAIMDKVREIIDRVTLAVEYVFLFTLLAGLTVLYAAIQATRDERLYESAMLRTLGARKAVILKSLAAEFALLGLLAGVLAALGASVLGYALAEFLFGFPYRGGGLLWLVGGAVGLAGVGAAGLLGARPVLRQPPMRTLREG